jgi:hypothetical protein
MEHVISIKDYATIVSIKFKFPHLMNEHSEEEIKKEYYRLFNKKDDLYNARKKVRELEKEYEELEKEWNAKKDLFDIEFKEDKKVVTTEKSYMTINGAVVYDCNKRR